MATVSELVKHFAMLTDTRPEEGVVRARHLREAGLLPSTGRGRGGAQISAVDCAVYTVSWLASERAINGPRAVALFANFMPHSVVGDLRNLEPQARSKVLSSQQISSDEPAFLLPGTPFIEAIEKLIEWARKPEGFPGARILEVTNIIDSSFEAIGCSRDWPYAFLRMKDSDGALIQQDYRHPPNPEGPHGIRLEYWQLKRNQAPAAIGIDAYLPASIIYNLAYLLGETGRGPTHLAEVELPSDGRRAASQGNG